MTSRQKLLLTIIKVLIAACFFVLLIVKSDMIFPYVAAKAITFRTLVSLCFVFYLLLALERPDYRPNFKNLLVFSVTVFAASMIISAFFGVDVIKSLWGDIERSEGVFQYLHYYIYFLIVVATFKERKDFELMMKVYLVAAAFISFYGWAQYFGIEGATLTGAKLDRIYGTLGNAIYLAAVMIFAIFFAIYFLFKKHKNFIWPCRIGIIFLLTIFVLTFFQASSRGALFGLALSALVAALLFIFWLPREYKKYKKLAVLLLIFGALFVAGISYFKDDISFIKENGLLYRLVDFSVIKNISSVPRFWSWQAAVEGFLEKPIFGWGPENYASIFNKYFNIRHYPGETWFDRSHNMILDVLSSQGIVGFLSYMAVLVIAVYLIFKMVKREPQNKFVGIWMLALLAAYFGQNMLVFDTLNTYILFYFFLGFIYAESRISQTNPAPEQARCGAGTDNTRTNADKFQRKPALNQRKPTNIPFLPALCFLSFIWILVAWWGSYLPYKSNKTLAYVFRSINQNFDAAVLFYKEGIKINSPFTLLDIQRRTIFPFMDAMSGHKIEKTKMKTAIDLAISEGERALKAHPLESQMYWILGELYNRAGLEYQDTNMILRAEEILKNGLKISSRRPEYVYALAQNYMLRGDYQKAIEIVAEFSSLIPHIPAPHLILAKIYAASGALDSAVKEIDAAIGLSHHINNRQSAPNDIVIMASIYRKAGEYNKIIKIYEDLLEIEPENANYLFELSEAYAGKGDKSKAKEIAEYILRLNNLDSKLKTEVEKFIENLK